MNPTLGLLLPFMLANPPVAPVPAMTGAECRPVMTPQGVVMACPPTAPPAPVLAVKVIAPAGVLVNYRPGVAGTLPVAAPAQAGFRPGFRTVIELTNLSGHPSRSLYPIVETYGSLAARASLNVFEFPAPIYLSQNDLDRAAAGALITKVVYLEDPTRAAAVNSAPDAPLEFTDLAVEDALKAARDNGRLAMIVRLGDRVPDAGELRALAPPGAVVLPGEPIGPPTARPMFGCYAIPTYDPIAGPRLMSEECITDGGDKGDRLGIGPGQALGGLNPTDVAVEYTHRSKRKVATSNEVCICSPRFVTRRVELAAVGLDLAKRPAILLQAEGRLVASNNVAAAAFVERVRPVEAVGRTRPALTVVSQGVAQILALSAPVAVAQVRRLQQVVGAEEPDEITNGPDQLVLTKEVDPKTAVQAGQEVTITLRYRNATADAATDLILSDSLSGRLEYVTGSQQSDRAATVTTAPNAAGSVAVRFAIDGPIPPGGSGVVKFRVKVR